MISFILFSVCPSGENILHMTIIGRNIEETRWLLDFYRDHEHSVTYGLEKLLTANASGQFFYYGGNNYFGGYPLHFAVCSNDKVSDRSMASVAGHVVDYA